MKIRKNRIALHHLFKGWWQLCPYSGHTQGSIRRNAPFGTVPFGKGLKQLWQPYPVLLMKGAPLSFHIKFKVFGYILALHHPTVNTDFDFFWLNCKNVESFAENRKFKTEKSSVFVGIDGKRAGSFCLCWHRQTETVQYRLIFWYKGEWEPAHLSKIFYTCTVKEKQHEKIRFLV